jgi:hypothetical protein
MSAAKPEPDDETIAEIVRHLPPVDWEQVKRLAQMSPAERVLVGIRAAETERAAVREKLSLLYPHLSPSQLNMKVLAHFTPIRMPKSDPRHPDNY